MNPYESTVTVGPELNVVRSPMSKRNPAKPHLIACAGITLLGTIVALVGLIVILWEGPARVLIPQTMAFISFGLFFVTSAYFAFGKFGMFNRVLTVIWAIGAILGIVFIITFVDPIDPTDLRNLPGLIVLSGCFALLGHIAWLCAFSRSQALTAANIESST